MKANFKGRGGIKGLLLLHGEKIAIVIVGALALWFIYSSLKLPGLDSQYEASNLQSKISQTNTQIETFDWDTAVRDHADKMRVAKPVAKSADLIVDSKPFEFDGLDPAVIAPTILRADPELINATAVRAVGGSGLLAFTDPATRKRQELKLAREQEELAKEQEKLQQQQQQENERRPGGQRGRNRPGGPQDAYGEVDPRFPNRRTVEFSTQAAGVPTQGLERNEHAHWAMVVAKVPIREQLNRYRDAFENARGGFSPERDFPRYVGFVVERCEVVGGKLTPWARVSLYDGQKKSLVTNNPIERGVTFAAVNRLYETAAREWAGMSLDPVDSRYKNYVLTLPLPPLVGRDWAADATHPDIPLAVDAPLTEEPIDPLADQPEQKAAASDEDLSFDAGDQNQAANIPGGFGQGPGAAQSFRGPSGYGGQGEFSRGPMMAMEMRGQGGGEYGGAMSYGGGMPSAGQPTTLPRDVNFYLLRFFDFTVEPGKQYKYRVKLALADPNQGLPDNVLEHAVQDRQRKEWEDVKARMGDKAKRPTSRVVAEWSEPSATVGIPLSGSVWLAEATPKAEKLHNDEPTVTLWAETFDLDKDSMPINIAQEDRFRRGEVVNLFDKMKYAGEGGRWVDTLEDSYKLYTGYTLLDVDGAEKLGRDMASPARVLLMGPAGELMIRSEPDDRPAVGRLRLIFAERKGRGGEEGRMPGEMPYGRSQFGGRGARRN